MYIITHASCNALAQWSAYERHNASGLFYAVDVTLQASVPRPNVQMRLHGVALLIAINRLTPT